jgi:hypothetical protein
VSDVEVSDMTMAPIPAADAMYVYAAVGQALSTWTTVETDLTMAFYNLCGTQTRQQAAAILDTIIAFDIRVDVLNALFALKKPAETDAELWRKVIERCRKYYKKRHEIAHFRLMAIERKKGVVTAEIAPFFSYEKWMTSNLPTLTIVQIDERATKFEQMHFALLWIVQKLAVEEQPTEYFAPDPEEPELITQLRALALLSIEERAQRNKA